MPVLDTRELLGVAFGLADPEANAAALEVMASVRKLAGAIAKAEGVTVETWEHFEDNEAAFSPGSEILDEIDPDE